MSRVPAKGSLNAVATAPRRLSALRLCFAILPLALAACVKAPPLPEHARPTLAGALAAIPNRSFNLGELPKAQYEGRVVMVYFVATWCFPCMADLAIINKLHSDFSDQGYVTILVGMDLEGAKLLRPFAEYQKFPYPLVEATEFIRSGDTVFGRIRELPTRYVFARDGSLALAYSGVADPSALISEVKKLVDQTVSR
jgi:thiol-disulfide isomerase/thioredoxin